MDTAFRLSCFNVQQAFVLFNLWRENPRFTKSHERAIRIATHYIHSPNWNDKIICTIILGV